MTMYRLLALTLLISSISCRAGDFGTSDKVFMTGGVCTDDPLSIVQKSETRVKGKPRIKHYEFSNECEVLGRDESVFDTPPTSFVCRSGGNTLLAGATYKKVKNSIIKSTDVMQVDTRVYIYECIKGCEHSPKKIRYSVGDCG